jgi:hypothetical protein
MAFPVHPAGPSGRNVEYLLNLAQAVRQMGVEDDHLFALERHVLGTPHSSPHQTEDMHSFMSSGLTTAMFHVSVRYGGPGEG